MRKNKIAVAFLGPPGSGKTTIADKLAQGKRIAVIKTGNLLREHIKQNTQLSKKLLPYLSSGKLAPPEIVTEVIRQKIGGLSAQAVIFDGFPRLEDEINPFFRLTHESGYSPQGIVIFRLPRTEILKRLTGRRICSHCGAVYNIHLDPSAREGVCPQCGHNLKQRPDDKTEIVNERIDEYEKNTAPVEKFFQEEYPDITVTLSARKPNEEIVESIETIMKR